MYYIKKIETIDLCSLYNKHNLFTCGNNTQYDKMFKIASKGITKKELGYLLYLCSDCGLDKIMDIIHPLFIDGSNYS